MEIKLTADKKLMEALERLTAAITVALGGSAPVSAASSTVPATAEKASGVTTPPATSTTPSAQTTSDTEDTAPRDDMPSREEIQRLAIIKVQGGKRDAVKALIAKYGASRVSEVPGDKLAGFKTELEAL